MGQILTTGADLVEATLATAAGQPEPTHRDQPNADKWQDSLKSALRSSRQLLDAVGITTEFASSASEREFPVFAPLEYVSRMRCNDPSDPLLLQVLASAVETSDAVGVVDPVGDGFAELIPGLLRKYQRRVLLITSGACAIHCRYCFRRHYPYQAAPKGLAGWRPALDAIANDSTVDEIILSGGDPLSVTDVVLQELIEELDAIPHLARIRVHTRFPIVIPSRICHSLLKWVRKTRLAVYFVLHINHSAEIDAEVELSLCSLRKAGAVLLNQAVLLAGVNDTFEAQRDLCLHLINKQVLPYYLHQLDRVRGALHFEVSDDKALKIISDLRRNLPGYAVPQLVREIAGRPHKMPVTV